MKRALITVSCALFAASALPVMAAKDFNLNADVGFATDDNVTKAESGDDIREDTFLNGTGGFSYQQDLTFRSLIVYRGSLAIEQYDEFDGLSNFALTGAVDYKIQFDRGFTAAGYTLTAFVQEHDFDSDMRDSTTFGLQGTMAKRFTDRMAGTFGLGFKTRESESDTFDTDTTRLFGNIDLVLTDQFVTYGTLQWVSGDVVSTATPTLDIINTADSIEADDAFGGEDTGRFAYRLDADTTLLTLGLNYGLNRANSFDGSIELLNSDADSVEYDRTVFRFSYLGIF